MTGAGLFDTAPAEGDAPSHLQKAGGGFEPPTASPPFVGVV